MAKRERLAPETFRLPVQRLREGYYSDAYFVFTKQLLEDDDHHPRVLMQVFQLIRGANDFTADIVLVDGKLCAKAGRQMRTNDRLTTVH